MLANRQLTIKRLLDSKNGIHLTAYLKNSVNEPESVSSQLRNVVQRAEHFLLPALDGEQREVFLKPLYQLLTENHVFSQMKGNIGIFRTQDSFRVLSLPVDVRTDCIVASSFHVKPLLKWLQSDQTFLLLGIGEGEAQLYCGSQHSLIKVDSLNYEERLSLMRERKAGKTRGVRAVISVIFDWLDEIVGQSQQKIYLAGERHLTEVFIKYARQRNVVKTPVWSSFSPNSVSLIADVVRKLCKRELSLKLEKAIFELQSADRRELDEVAEAAARGAVKKLIVSDDIRIFGKFDASTGALTIHPDDLDHEDDDLLDDLAQTVLAHGGEVYVARPEQLPSGLPFLASVDGAHQKHAQRQIQV